MIYQFIYFTNNNPFISKLCSLLLILQDRQPSAVNFITQLLMNKLLLFMI